MKNSFVGCVGAGAFGFRTRHRDCGSGDSWGCVLPDLSQALTYEISPRLLALMKQVDYSHRVFMHGGRELEPVYATMRVTLAARYSSGPLPQEAVSHDVLGWGSVHRSPCGISVVPILSPIPLAPRDSTSSRSAVVTGARFVGPLRIGMQGISQFPLSASYFCSFGHVVLLHSRDDCKTRSFSLSLTNKLRLLSKRCFLTLTFLPVGYLSATKVLIAAAFGHHGLIGDRWWIFAFIFLVRVLAGSLTRILLLFLCANITLDTPRTWLSATSEARGSILLVQ